ncbi:cell wall / vacuolar inhibitor of fructosidase 2-like [Tasmannia lanceolata]|uniref:cell wall / vacuolar inhibitor of fructosidase 2-like n=1 Tax=Tasmannia lanceolata TaxID=3420 RepID=UPI0040642E58
MAAIFRSLLVFPLLLALFFHQISASYVTETGTDLIRTTCNQTYFYDLCVSCLESDPRSSTGNLNVFAEIITELALSNMTDITTYISELYNKTTEPVMKERLRICLALYQDGVPTLKKGLTSLKDKNYDDALGYVASAEGDPVNCGNQFSDPRNEKLDQLCRIAITMIKNLGHIEKFTITSSP